jgi:hypothetical protein
MIYHWLATSVLLVTGVFLVTSNETLPLFVSVLILIAGIWLVVCGSWIFTRRFSGLQVAKITHACIAAAMGLVSIASLGIATYTFIDYWFVDPRGYSGWAGMALVAAGALLIIGAAALALAVASRWAAYRFAARSRLDCGSSR